MERTWFFSFCYEHGRMGPQRFFDHAVRRCVNPFVWATENCVTLLFFRELTADEEKLWLAAHEAAPRDEACKTCAG
jgi:hypothetical protein